MATEKVLITVYVDKEDSAKVDRMMADDAIYSRSAFVRRMIRQEWQRRYQPVRLVADAVAEVVAVEQSSNLLSD